MSGPLHLKLNCFALGDNPRRVFEIKIAPTEDVSALRELIKDAKKPEFDHVAADSLKLWKVDLPDDETIEDSLNSLTLDTKKSLVPVAEMLEVFDNDPQPKHLHIVIQGPPAVSSGPLHLKLNCIVLGDDPSRIFPVDIAQTQTVGDLRKVIKDKKKPHFDHVDADSLKLWNVKINLNDLHLLNAIGDESVKLKPLTELSEVLTDGVERGCIHVVVVQHPTYELHIPFFARRLAYLDKGAGAPSGGPNLGRRYPRSYINSTGHIQEFSYDETPIPGDRVIFFGEIVGDATGSKICIKFVKHYSPEAHEFCASKGHAPKLRAYNPLSGSWNMVVMDALDIDNDCSPQRPGSYRLLSEIAVPDRQPLKEAITSLIQELHNYNDGYVHGDLRDTNFVVGDNNHFMLLDFDWTGPIQKTHYPMYINRKDIRRPDGVWDGEKIVAKHDLDMLEYLFHPEQDGQEPAAKRRRTSLPSDEESPIAI